MLVLGDMQRTDGGRSRRDDSWLRLELNYLWSAFFKDVPRVNIVDIGYAPFWKTRLGLITLSQTGHKTIIRINGFLSFPEVPEYVATATIAHELIHYSHGFGSPLPQKYRSPHRGGIVTKELLARGLGIEHSMSNRWLKENWHYLIACADEEGWRDVTRRSAASPHQEISDGLQAANTLSSDLGSLK